MGKRITACLLAFVVLAMLTPPMFVKAIIPPNTVTYAIGLQGDGPTYAITGITLNGVNVDSDFAYYSGSNAWGASFTITESTTYTLTFPSSLFDGEYYFNNHARNGAAGSLHGDLYGPWNSSIYTNIFTNIYDIVNATYGTFGGTHLETTAFINSLSIIGNVTTITFNVPYGNPWQNDAELINFYYPVGMDLQVNSTLDGSPANYGILVNGTTYTTPETLYVDLENSCGSPCGPIVTLSAPTYSTFDWGTGGISGFLSWSDHGTQTHDVDLSTYWPWGTVPPAVTAEYGPLGGGTGVCSPLPPTPLMQLENGCVIPAIVNTYADVIGLNWFFGIIVALVSAMLYEKSENALIPLAVNVIIAPVVGFLLPSPYNQLVYDFMILALAGVFYLLFRGNS